MTSSDAIDSASSWEVGMVTCDAVSSDREHDQHARQEKPFLEKDPVNWCFLCRQVVNWGENI